MRSISEAHVARADLAVVEVAAQCAIAAAQRTMHEPGVRLPFFLDLHPDDDQDNAVSDGPPAGTAVADTSPAPGKASTGTTWAPPEPMLNTTVDSPDLPAEHTAEVKLEGFRAGLSVDTGRWTSPWRRRS
ncbi:hypothetical protein NC239_36175 [Streptomyces sp. G3]|uniref:hypothetical protein n=1 Tax=unclassified Streptomyces TaxID=2593676 RepID=UPI00202F9D89|nr:hypothetical protein [Streptomyces sp. G3]MCM1943628.1 hypothetical protein [Streptomyces sp. G3]